MRGCASSSLGPSRWVGVCVGVRRRDDVVRHRAAWPVGSRNAIPSTHRSLDSFSTNLGFVSRMDSFLTTLISLKQQSTIIFLKSMLVHAGWILIGCLKVSIFMRELARQISSVGVGT